MYENTCGRVKFLVNLMFRGPDKFGCPILRVRGVGVEGRLYGRA